MKLQKKNHQRRDEGLVCHKGRLQSLTASFTDLTRILYTCATSNSVRFFFFFLKIFLSVFANLRKIWNFWRSGTAPLCLPTCQKGSWGMFWDWQEKKKCPLALRRHTMSMYQGIRWKFAVTRISCSFKFVEITLRQSGTNLPQGEHTTNVTCCRMKVLMWWFR